MSSIYEDYEDVLSFSDGVIYLKKDIVLDEPLVFNDGNYVFNIGNFIINSSDKFPAIVVNNSNWILTGSVSKGVIKGNFDYTIKIENSTVTFSSANVYAKDESVAVYIKDSNLIFAGTNIYGGNAREKSNPNKGNVAIFGEWTNNNYSIDVKAGKIRGGNGAKGNNNSVSSKGGKALVINNEIDLRLVNGSQLNNGANGDYSANDGGNAMELFGEITQNDVHIESFNVLYGGNGGKDNNKYGVGEIYDSSSSEYEVSYKTPSEYITSLKYQDSTSLCATFTHMSMAETYMLKYYNEYCKEHLYNGEFDLSEVMTGYGLRDNPPDPLGNASKSYEVWTKQQDGSQSKFWQIGAYTDTFRNYASQFRGLQGEESAPLNDFINSNYNVD